MFIIVNDKYGHKILINSDNIIKIQENGIELINDEWIDIDEKEFEGLFRFLTRLQ